MDSPPECKRMGKKTRRILAAFARLDDGEISTERLLNMTADACRVEIDDVVEALAIQATTKQEPTG